MVTAEGSSNYPHLFGFRCQVSHRSHVQSGFILHGPCRGFLDKILGLDKVVKFPVSQMARSEMQLVVLDGFMKPGFY